MSSGVAEQARDEHIVRLERRLTKARQKTAILEELIEDKTRSLFLAQQEVRKKSNYLESILRSMDSAVIVIDAAGRIVTVDGAVTQLIGDDLTHLFGRPVGELLSTDDGAPGTIPSPGEAMLKTATGELPVLVTVSPLSSESDGPSESDGHVGAVCVATDISDRKRLEVELRHAQKLESVGQLAAGVAHEINTPVQYIGDNVHFLGDVVSDLLELCDAYGLLRESAKNFDQLADAVTDVERAEEAADLEFVTAEAPEAVTRTLSGIERVSTIVRAMKQFSHPGAAQHMPTDLNSLVDTALIVATNEYKYVADVDFKKGSLPEVMCNEGDISQVLLNLVVNAAHAIADRVDHSDERGTISIETASELDGVSLSITDTGTGIPVGIRDRIFDPFFTTKEPGRGTGQGLAISYNVIVDKHQGRLSVESTEGEGSTFRIWLPERALS